MSFETDKENGGFSTLFSQLGRFENPMESLPSIESWTPDLSGEMDMVIKANGDWVHEGGIIKRQKLSRLFSSILKKEAEDYFLLTPVEKWKISVEDQPFVIALMEEVDGAIILMTNMGEEVTLGPDCLLEVDDHEAPKVLIRKNLYARLSRTVFYQLAEMTNKEADGFFIESQGQRIKLG
ncbi:MAG: hypothetical protein ACJA0E_000366 [Bermanella sp.]|jgi:hypothetical protein